MDYSNPSLMQEERLSSVRRRNKILIVSFFSSIILLALITGGIIISVVQKINSKPLDSNRAVREFCSPFEFQSSCVTLLSSEINAPPNANPNRIFLLSLESSLRKLSNVVDEARSEPALSNCSSSLGHATSQLNKIVEMMRIDSDLEAYEREDMTACMAAAAEDVAACVEDLGKAVSAAADGVSPTVAEVAAAVGYSRDFLVNCDVVNEKFRWGSASDRSLRDEIVENLMTVSLFGSQYFVLVFLFCLLLRIY